MARYKGLCRSKWIENLQSERIEVTDVSRCDRQAVHFRRGRDHGIFIERIGFPVHQSRPRPEGRRIHWQNVIGACNQFQPRFNFFGFAWVLLSRQLNTCLYLTEGHCGEVQLGVINRLQPGNHACVWARFAELRDHIRVKQIQARHSIGSTGRRLAVPRAGTFKSERAWSERSSCFKEGRAADCKRRHSCTGTSTAASEPLLVTICGPSTRQASRNSLKRAFAS